MEKPRCCRRKIPNYEITVIASKNNSEESWRTLLMCALQKTDRVAILRPCGMMVIIRWDKEFYLEENALPDIDVYRCMNLNCGTGTMKKFMCCDALMTHLLPILLEPPVCPPECPPDDDDCAKHAEALLPAESEIKLEPAADEAPADADKPDADPPAENTEETPPDEEAPVEGEEPPAEE